MKRIRRVEQPTPGLAEYRSVEWESPSWDGFRSHRSGAAYRELRTALVENQRGLCCYCEIDLVSAGVQIEHVRPRSAAVSDPGGELGIGNLLASCYGGTKRSPRPQVYSPPVGSNRSCGPAKGGASNPAFLDPRDSPASPSLYRVDPEGRITPDADACAAVGVPVSRVAASIRLVGLDVGRLRRARVAVRRDLLRLSAGDEDDSATVEEVARQVLSPDTDGRLLEFFTTARSYFGDAAEAVLAEAPEDCV